MPKLEGVIIDGIYYPKGEKPVIAKRAVTDKRWDHDMQRAEHKRDLLQPYKNGKLSEDFIQQFPNEAKEYGFKPKE